MSSEYKPLQEYFLTVKFNNLFYRYFKFEQGQDKSLYINWNLQLAQHKDGNQNKRSYISYHSKYDNDKKGYRVHQKGCGGNRIKESISYRNKFISEYSNYFFSANFDQGMDHLKIATHDSRDIVFNIEISSKFVLRVFSNKRRDLLESDYPNELIREIEFQGYSLILQLLIDALIT